MSDADSEESVFPLMHRMAAHFGPETNVVKRARSAIESIVARTKLSTVDWSHWTTISHTEKAAIPFAVRDWLQGQGVEFENGMKESESNQEAHLSHTVVPATSCSAQIENSIENLEENICKADDDDVQFKSTGEAEVAFNDRYAHSATRDVAEIRPDRAEEHSNVGDNGSTVLGQLVSAASDDSSLSLQSFKSIR